MHFFCLPSKLHVHFVLPCPWYNETLVLQVPDGKPAEWGEQCWGIHRCPEARLSLCGMWVCFLVAIILCTVWSNCHVMVSVKENLFLLQTQQKCHFSHMYVRSLETGSKKINLLKYSFVHKVQKHARNLSFWHRERERDADSSVVQLHHLWNRLV